MQTLCRIVVWTGCFIGIASAYELLGQTCFNHYTDRNGTCVKLYDCPSALKKFQKLSIDIKYCGSINNVWYVCCNDANLNVHKPYQAPVADTKHARRCKGYQSFVYETTDVILLTFDIQSIVSKVDTCGARAEQLEVGSDEVAGKKEFPHTALLGYSSGEWKCTGSLLSEEFVITAAYCIDLPEYGHVTQVRLGETDLTPTNDGQSNFEDFGVLESISYPRYTSSGGDDHNDIALIKLDRKVRFNGFIRPICLPDSKIAQQDNPFQILNWGLSSQANHGVLHARTVQEKRECNDGGNGATNSKICVELRGIEGPTPCDAGSSLQILHPSLYCMYTLIGVKTSPEDSCVEFARVSYYVDWIENRVWPGSL